MSVLYIKRTVLLTETMNSDIYILMHILGITVLHLRNEANYTYLPELTHRYSIDILQIHPMQTLHFLYKNRNTLSEQKLLIFTDKISTFYQDIFPQFERPA